MSNQEETKKEKAISLVALHNYPTALRKMAPWLVNVFFVTIIILALAFLSSYSLLITIPFVATPFFFALQLTHAYIHMKDDMDGRRFSGYVKTYFSPAGFGTYRIIRTTLFSLLFSVIGSFVFVLLYTYIGQANGLEINESLNAMMEAYRNNDSETMLSIMNSEPIASLYKWAVVFESFVFALSFLFHVLRYGVLGYFHFSMPNAGARSINMLYRKALHSAKTSGYNKDYFAAIWPVILVVALSLCLGIWLGVTLSNIESVSYFFANNSYFSETTFVMIIGMFVCSIFLLLSLPYYFEAMSMIYQKYESSFGEAAFEFANEALRQLKEQQKLGEEEQKQIEEALKELQKRQDELKSEEKPDGDSNDSSSNQDNQ